MSSDRRITLTWLAGVLVLVAFTIYSAGSVTHGFVSYYAAARLLVSGQLGPMAYDDAWFGAYVQAITQSSVREIFIPNPPTMALMALPLVGMGPSMARVVWLAVSLSGAAAAVLALLKYRASSASPASVAIGLVMLLNPSVFANLRIGQGYLIVLALVAATALLLIAKRDGLAGACLGLLLALKTSGVALFVLLVAQRRFRAAGWAIAGALVLAIGITPWVDRAMWLDYPMRVREYVERPASSVTAYQSTMGLVRHLCVADPTWNPSPAANCASVAFVAPTFLIGLATLMTIGAAWRSPTRVAAWVAAGVCLSELALPAAAEPHFALLVVPLALVPMEPWLFAIFAALFLVPLEYTAETFTNGWTALLAYPRLYANWLLWAVAIRACWTSAQRDGHRH